MLSSFLWASSSPTSSTASGASGSSSWSSQVSLSASSEVSSSSSWLAVLSSSAPEKGRPGSRRPLAGAPPLALDGPDLLGRAGAKKVREASAVLRRPRRNRGSSGGGEGSRRCAPRVAPWIFSILAELSRSPCARNFGSWDHHH